MLDMQHNSETTANADAVSATIMPSRCACCTTKIMFVFSSKVVVVIVFVLMQGKKQYTEKLFTSFQLSQYIPPDNFYRRLKEMLDLHWLNRATQKYYGTEGQKSIDPVVFMKLILIGYLENLGSDRQIMTTVSMGLDMLFFLGYDLDEPLP
jgi:hypothetical protein